MARIYTPVLSWTENHRFLMVVFSFFFLALYQRKSVFTYLNFAQSHFSISLVFRGQLCFLRPVLGEKKDLDAIVPLLWQKQKLLKRKSRMGEARFRVSRHSILGAELVHIYFLKLKFKSLRSNEGGDGVKQ